MPGRLLRALIALAAAACAVPAFAQPVTSAAPDSVSVTIYRAPDRDDGALNLEWLRGYALITEKRTVAVPKGPATIRFEGVAAGIVPESALVSGLPDGVREKNMDAALLSPRSLYAGTFGRPVTIRRTLGDKVTEERAIIRSGPDGAAILETKEGFIAADCGPQTDELVYDSVPAGLSAKPTLSVQTDSSRAGTVTLTLTYLAWGFDWQANYVADMRPDGKTADLFAWVTLANGDVTSFADAETMVVAGKIEREDDPDDSLGRFKEDDEFELHCFTHNITTILAQDIGALPTPAPMAMADGDIVVTGSLMRRSAAVTVEQEALGDLKLYRVPHATTVAAKSQKQVALLDRKSVPVDIVYRSRVYDPDDNDESEVKLTLRAQNRKAKGLGLPLPSGGVALFAPQGDARLLIGEGWTGDKAVNEEVEVEIATATQVHAVVKQVLEDDAGHWRELELTVTNANPFPVAFEGELEDSDSWSRARSSAKLGRKNGRDLWAIEVPANGTKTLRYRLTEATTND